MASLALLINSRRKMSLCEYSECTMICRICFNSVLNCKVSELMRNPPFFLRFPLLSCIVTAWLHRRPAVWYSFAMPRRKLPPTHPGEVLREEFITPLGISQYRLAKDTSVPPRRINEIIQGSRAISADTALRLARYFGTSERFWLNLQGRYDLEVAKDRLGSRLQREVKRAPLGSTAGDKHMSYAADNV